MQNSSLQYILLNIQQHLSPKYILHSTANRTCFTLLPIFDGKFFRLNILMMLVVLSNSNSKY
jgi:hypothetical protein